MSVPLEQARRRWLAMNAVRLAGMVGAVFGLVLSARAQETLPKVIGIALVLAALSVIAIVPASLAHRWRSEEP